MDQNDNEFQTFL